MIQIIRRSSTSQRRQDYLQTISQKIAKHRKCHRRQSINPMTQEGYFSIIKDDNISPECLDAILNHIEKRVVIIGVILPPKILLQCCELLTEEKVTISHQSLFGIFLDHEKQLQAATLMLFLSEERCTSQSRIQLHQRVLYGLSMVWIVNQGFMRKRWHMWQTRQQIFGKQPSLFLLKEGHPILPEDVVQKLDAIFWSIEVFSYGQMNRRGPKFSPHLLAPTREAYKQLSQQSQGSSLMKEKLQQISKVSLKNNYRFSCSLLCYPFLYSVSCWIREEQRSRKQLTQLSINNYFQMLQDDFNNYLQTLHIPSDQLKLRSTVGTEKKMIFLSVRKHLTMLEGIFPKQDPNQKYLDSLTRLLNERQENFYKQNLRVATIYNENILTKLYSELIQKRFVDECESERTLKEYQSDFQAFLDCYGSDSIRVASQLKTFNEFLMQRKISYAQNLQKELQNSKRRFTNEKDELKDRLDIQMSVLETLQEEIRQLESKRQSIESENSELKNTIGKIRQKSSRQSVSNSPLLPRRQPLSVSNQDPFRQTKLQVKVGKSRRSVPDDRKGRCGCCCCEIM